MSTDMGDQEFSSNKSLSSRLMSTQLSARPVEAVKFTDEPKVNGFIAFPSSYAKERYFVDNVNGIGYDDREGRAKMKSVAELLERLSLYNPQESQLTPPTKLEASLLEYLVPWNNANTQSQASTKRERDLKNLRWKCIQGKEMLSGTNVLIPSQLVFLSPTPRNEHQLSEEVTSNGTALGEAGQDGAFTRCILELIERDACLHAYLSRDRVLEMTDFPATIAHDIEYFRRYRLEPHIFCVPSVFSVPVVLTVLVDRTGIGPAVTVGSSAGLRYYEAIAHSMMEALHVRNYTRLMWNAAFSHRVPRDDKVLSLEDRLYYWYPVKRIKHLDFWLKNPPTISYSEVRRKCTTIPDVVNQFRARNFHLIRVDISLPEIRDAGLEVVKVIIPELIPFYLNERAKTLYSVNYGELPEISVSKPHPFA
jgi:ribosomal protein S12 methylthiotransferase accessory factor